MLPYKHFTPEERQIIQENMNKGKKTSEIAKLLTRNRSSVSREISRNSSKKGYNWWYATCQYMGRRRKSVRKHRLKCVKVRAFVIEGFKKYWSPEIIVARYKRENPGEKLSHNTIYRAVKSKELPDITPKTHLRRHGKRRNAHNSQSIKPVHKIHDRPSVIETRGRTGDLEGDTVYGGIGKGCLLTLVDRCSRMLYAASAKSRDSAVIEDTFKKALGNTPVNSITLDNGSEFAKFNDIEKNHDTSVFFADPHSPWQRGSIENINGLIRFFFPKGTNFLDVSDDDILSVLALINNRPRKCLDWLSPLEFLCVLNNCKLCCT